MGWVSIHSLELSVGGACVCAGGGGHLNEGQYALGISADD